MSFTSSGLPLALTVAFVVLVLLPTQTYAFGAGEIPDFSYLNEKAFRHGDIENILTDVVKAAAHSGGGGGLIGFAKKIANEVSGGKKFSKKDIKRIYFGNWLRDYSQAMDIAGLSKLTAETLVLVVSVLGFMEFGYTTEEYEITAERLGVYLPVEHIDNPKGYAEKEGDARQFHPKLRPPVEDQELEIDERTGMKKYMATEDEGFDSSTAHLKRIFRSCIEHYHRSGGDDNSPDLWEAYRLMGTGLHTLEDLLAHSNWIELGLKKLGHEEVYCHVGDRVYVEAPTGDRVPPLITGTFGSADFMHSMLGEATDKLSQTSVTALNDKLSQSSQSENSNLDFIKNIMSKIPKSDDSDQEKVNHGSEIEEKSKAYNFDPDDVAPKEVQDQLVDLLKWRDDVMRNIEKKLEMIPGLTDLIEELTLAMNAYVYTLLAPYVTPILSQVTTVIGEGSKEIIEAHDDQTEVFDNPNASDPSHSMLSKDHFGLILNEPAGKIAQVVVIHSVNILVKAFEDENCDVDAVVDEILEAFHHPYYATGRSQIQQLMFEELDKWIGGQGHSGAQEIISKLTKDAVREHKNVREGSEEESGGGHGHGGGHSGGASGGGYGGGGYSGGGEERSSGGGYDGGHRNEEEGGGYGGAREEQQTYASGGEPEYGHRSSGYEESGGHGRSEHESSGYESRRHEESGYEGGGRSNYDEGNQPFGHGGGGYNSERTDINDSGGYAHRSDNQESGDYGRDESYGGGGGHRYGQEESSGGYGGGEPQRRYGGGEEESSGYGGGGGGYQPSYEGGGGHHGRHEEGGYGGGNSYGEGREEHRYGGGREENTYGGGREDSSYGGGHGGGREEGSFGHSEEPSYGHGGEEDVSRGFDRMNINDAGGYARGGGDEGYNEDGGYAEERHHRRDDESEGYQPSYY